MEHGKTTPTDAPADEPDFSRYDGLGGGWGPAPGPPPPRPRAGPDFCALFVLLDALRRTAPAELQERLAALIREALLTLRSLIDWYLERLDSKPRERRVEDIPID